jgi:hypothetical protein
MRQVIQAQSFNGDNRRSGDLYGDIEILTKYLMAREARLSLRNRSPPSKEPGQLCVGSDDQSDQRDVGKRYLRIEADLCGRLPAARPGDRGTDHHKRGPSK